MKGGTDYSPIKQGEQGCRKVAKLLALQVRACCLFVGPLFVPFLNTGGKNRLIPELFVMTGFLLVVSSLLASAKVWSIRHESFFSPACVELQPVRVKAYTTRR